MLASRLRHRIHFQEPIDTEVGEAVVRTWNTVYLDSDTPLDSVPAEVLTGPGRELHAAGTKLAELDARIGCRWFAGLDPAWRILWDGRMFNIVSIETDATGRREWRIKVKYGLSDGT